jgi:curved DNA-binding protein CbpA
LQSNDPYAVLGLRRGAAPREVKRAYFTLVREYPPESHPAEFKLLRQAYERLRSGGTKAETDLFLFRPPYPWEPRKRRRKLDLEVHAEDAWRLMEQRGDLGRRDFQEDYRTVDLYE